MVVQVLMRYGVVNTMEPERGNLETPLFSFERFDDVFTPIREAARRRPPITTQKPWLSIRIVQIEWKVVVSNAIVALQHMLNLGWRAPDERENYEDSTTGLLSVAADL